VNLPSTNTFPAYFLGGATATGKTAVAHQLAARMHLPVLSADSMLVYKGMDIGTAKPSREERGALAYYGLDITEPCCDFSSADWLAHVAEIARRGALDRGVIVVGGTGLYFKLLWEGLSVPGACSHLRAELENLYASEGVPGLRQRLDRASPDAGTALADPFNPRRLIRAIEIAETGMPPQATEKKEPCAMTALHLERTWLAERIAQRVAHMFAAGFEHEVASLMSLYPLWSRSASQAIGYQEVRAALEHHQKTDDPSLRASICTRTRRLAKRQQTWFRHQHNTHWVDVSSHSSTDAIVEAVAHSWSVQGPLMIDYPATPLL